MDGYRILFVDDDPAILRAFGRTLQGGDCHVDLAPRADEALRLLESRSFDVLAADHRMPGVSGLELLQRAREVAPDTRRILISGQCDLALAVEAINRAGVDRLILKPWSAQELRAAVRASAHGARRTNDLLDSLVRALDLRDSETQWHSRRVSAYARYLGASLGLSGDALLNVERGALLHDIGKIGVSDLILLKPGPLTEFEWSEMRRHPALGYELLRNLDFLAGARQVVLQHQERWDGLGYPAGLRGEEICLGARIFHIVDTYDAITSDRPYRAARGYAAARAEIVHGAGTQFDPRMVEAWCAIDQEIWAELRRQVGAGPHRYLA